MTENPIVIGTISAALAALTFGIATPFIQRFGAEVGPFTTAALLYLGAAFGTLGFFRREQKQKEAAVHPRHLPRLLAVALLGAALSPTLFAWGLQRVPATLGSLLLNSEAIFTVALAALFYREYVGKRVALAACLMFGGGAVTITSASASSPVGLMGALAVTASVFLWALDNVLTRPLADLDPTVVVRAKALFGVVLTGLFALKQGEPVPDHLRIAGLLTCGAAGYGLSLRLYLLAQRRIGAGRTGSVFAAAPFVGALTAVLLGDRPAGLTTSIAALLFIAGIALHLTEKHGHRHRHESLSHDHAHSHEDGHHDHSHNKAESARSHAHPHTHDARVHAHPHAPDVHHRHAH
jgi:drug/metabolite transporter (DMT)-like permease